MQGPGRAPGAAPRGARLGLPEDGPGSVARPGRRIVALFIDWFSCMLISAAFFDSNSFATMVTFAVVQVITVGTIGFGPGHRICGLRVQRLDGRLPGPLRALVRTLLLCLVIPAVVYDSDGRGLHDRAAGTVLVLI